MNFFKTGILMAGMTALFLAIGFLLGRETGMVLALAFAVATNVFAYWNADKMVLRMNGAREVTRNQEPGFYAMVERLSRNANLPMPKTYIMDQDQPNAFATGRNPENAAVAATTGLLRNLSPDEIEGVMAHELAHIKNRDTSIMAFTATIAGAIAMLTQFGFLFQSRDRNSPISGMAGLAMMVLAPLAAMIVQMAISRTREYAADRGGAEISGKPLALASALQRISQAAHAIPNETAERNPAMAHVFIINPLAGLRADALFSTHPPTGRRISELQKIAAEMGKMETPIEVSQPGPWSTSKTAEPVKRGPWG